MENANHYERRGNDDDDSDGNIEVKGREGVVFLPSSSSSEEL